VASATSVAVIGFLTGRDVLLTVQTAIALAVAAVPEGLPIVATAALARGLWRMARRNAVIERLTVVETLGSTDLIITDKTGTLTENRMSVVRIMLEDGTVVVDAAHGRFTVDGAAVQPSQLSPLRQALIAAALCSDVPLVDSDDGRSHGDPLELALLAVANSADLDRRTLLAATPEVRREPFDPHVKLMATVHIEEEGFHVAVKGAPEAVIQAASRKATVAGVRALEAQDRESWLERNRTLAEQGLRVIAVATKHQSTASALPFEELTLLALIGLLDPPRPRVREAIAACRRAGIRIVMATGDQAATARTVAESVELIAPGDPTEVLPGSAIRPSAELTQDERSRLLAAPIFARATPEQKLWLLELHRENGAVVAMLGDGVNDAPALERADIGVAMGLRGTEVARKAADMVLRDDHLESVVAAIEEGRTIFGNLRRFIVFLLSCNLSEILVVGLASLVAAPPPILPLQILFLNIVTDVFPALALGACEGTPGGVGGSPRRPREPILVDRHWRRIAGGATVITAAVFGAYAFALEGLDLEVGRAVTVSFLVLALSQLGHVGNMTSRRSGALRNEVTRNPWIWASLAFCLALLLASVRWAPLAQVLGTADPGPQGWLLALVAGLVPFTIGRLAHLARNIESSRPPTAACS
jgi:Ca2+-transporting ATPase